MNKKANGVSPCFLLAVVCVAACIFLSWDKPQQAFEIYLKRSFVSDTSMVSLKDLIHSFSGKPYALDLSKVTLEVTPGRLCVMGASTIRRVISFQYVGRLIVVGREITIIPRDMVGSDRVRFFEQLGGYLTDKMHLAQARLELECTGTLSQAEYMQNDMTFTLAYASTRNGVAMGPAVLRYASRSNRDSFSGEINVVLHVYAPVAVPKEVIRRGERFEKADVLEREVDLSSFQEDLLISEEIGGVFTASQNLYPDRPIPLKKVSRALFVRTGDKVALTFVKKNITIGLQGRALGSGTLDDHVAVRPEGTNRKFKGLVTGDKEVLIELQ